MDKKKKSYYINLDLEGRKYQIAHAQTYLTPERIWDKSRFYMGDGHYQCFIRGMEEHNEFISVVGHTATERIERYGYRRWEGRLE